MMIFKLIGLGVIIGGILYIFLNANMENTPPNTCKKEDCITCPFNCEWRDKI